MISSTHFAFGILAASLACQTINPAILLIGGVASLLPDIDHTESVLGKLFFPISKLINDKFGHRTVTHSLLAIFVIALFSGGIFIYFPQIATAFFSGYLSAIVGDMLTKSGVKLLWPSQDNWAILENPILRFKTGGTGEFILLLIIFGGTIANFNAVSGGGISEVVSNYYSGLIGKKSAAVNFYNRHSNKHLIGLKITGYWASDRRPIIDEQFRIIYVEGVSTIFVQNPKTGYLYKLEQEIIVEKVRPFKEALGRGFATKTLFNDEKLGSKLKTGEYYYFGKVALDDLAAPAAPPTSLEYLNPYLIIEGNNAILQGAKREQISFLEEYVTGELTEVFLDY
jgi:inner membrane protein